MDTCFHLLTAPSNEEKLAGLLLVPRLVDPTDTATIRRVYESVGPSFVNHLLASCGKDPAFASLGLHVLGAVITPPRGDESDGSPLPWRIPHTVLKQTIQALLCVLEKCSRDPKILQETVLVLWNLLLSQDVSSLNMDLVCILGPELCRETAEVVLRCLEEEEAKDGVPDGEEDADLLGHLVALAARSTDMARVAGELPAAPSTLLPVFAKHIASTHGHSVALVVILVTNLVALVDPPTLAGLVQPVLQPMVFKLFCSLPRASEAERSCTLQLFASITQQLHSVMWSLEDEQNTENSPGTLLLLALDMAHIEMRVLLEQLVQGDGCEAEFSIPTPSSAQEGERILSSCFAVVESIVMLLLQLDDKVVRLLSMSRIEKLLEKLREAMVPVVHFLLHRKKMQLLDDPNPDLTLACLKLFGTYFADESSVLRDEVRELLPYLVNKCSANSTRGLELLLPFFQLYTSDVDQCEEFMKLHGHRIVLRYLHENLQSCIQSLQKSQDELRSDHAMIACALGIIEQATFFDSLAMSGQRIAPFADECVRCMGLLGHSNGPWNLVTGNLAVVTSRLLPSAPSFAGFRCEDAVSGPPSQKSIGPPPGFPG